jgi:DNA (cytosine-5)-methyltransferase 1
VNNLTGVSLFAGIGGFEIAMQRQGVEVVASVEIDKHASKLLQARFPLVKHFTDVKTVTGKELIDAGFKPESGIITGGFPCQDLSVAGRRAGLEGERSGLFWEIARILEETKSKYFIVENVPGLLSSSKGKDMGIVIGTLVELGYGVAWRVLDAQYFGVPQRRRRVFIVGCLGDETGAGKILFERNGLRRDIEKSKQTGQDTAANATRGTRKAVLGSGKDIANCIPAELYHHGTVVNQDANNGHVVIMDPVVGTLQARDHKGVGNQYVAENKLVVHKNN